MFVKIKDRVINANNVLDFELFSKLIRVSYVNGSGVTFAFNSENEAYHAHENIYRILSGKMTLEQEEIFNLKYESLGTADLPF